MDPAIEAMRQGQAVIVVDDKDRENEGDVVLAAAQVTAELTALMARYTSGPICVGVDGPILDRLDLPHLSAGPSPTNTSLP